MILAENYYFLGAEEEKGQDIKDIEEVESRKDREAERKEKETKKKRKSGSKHGKKSGKRSGMKSGKKNGRKSKNSGKRFGKKSANKTGKRSGNKSGGKSGRKSTRKGGERKQSPEIRASTCLNISCIDTAVGYLRMLKDKVANFDKQIARIGKQNKTGSKKSNIHELKG